MAKKKNSKSLFILIISLSALITTLIFTMLFRISLNSDHTYKDWNKYENRMRTLSFMYPDDFVVTEQSNIIIVKPRDHVSKHGVADFLRIGPSSERDFLSESSRIKAYYQNDTAVEIKNFQGSLVVSFLPLIKDGKVNYKHTYLNHQGEALDTGYEQVTPEEAEIYDKIISSIKSN